MDGEPYMPGAREAAETRQHMECAVDRQRHHRKRELHGERVGAALEATHTAVPRARTLRKHYHRHAAAQLRFGTLHGATQTHGRRVVDIYLSRDFAGITHKRDAPQLFLHHPPELMMQPSVDGEYIVCPLMVGYKHIARARVDVLTPLHAHPHPGEPAHQPAPHYRRIIAAPAPGAEHRRHYGDQSCDNGSHQHERQHDEYLVNPVEPHSRRAGRLTITAGRWRQTPSDKP